MAPRGVTRPLQRPAVLRVDEIGLEKGLADRLAEVGYHVEGFNASRRCGTDEKSALYASERARLAYDFREALNQGWVAMPDDPMLLEELRVYSAFNNQSGKLQCVAKDDLKKTPRRPVVRPDGRGPDGGRGRGGYRLRPAGSQWRRWRSSRTAPDRSGCSRRLLVRMFAGSIQFVSTTLITYIRPQYLPRATTTYVSARAASPGRRLDSRCVHDQT
jgi:hypothetical protein